MRIWRVIGALVAGLAGPSMSAGAPQSDTVVLLHGLGRGPVSMWPLARSLAREGYRVVNVSYPSRQADIATLARDALGPIFEGAGPGVAAGEAGEGARVHVVTHSLGGILVRRYLKDHGVPATLGRVVMIAPPNGGSEIVDTFSGWRLYARVNGPAGLALGTSSSHEPTALGALPPGVEAGVIAGDFSWNPVFSRLIPGPDDGKVSVQRTHLAGEADHLLLPYSHTWLMNRRETRRQVSAFLGDGFFSASRVR